MKNYKTISNKFGNINLYICQAQELEYILGIPQDMKDNSEIFVETYNSGGREEERYSDNVKHAMSDKGNPIERNYIDFISDFPFVVPIIPCLKGLPDFQQMSVESIELYKIHEKVKDCIDEARITGVNLVNGEELIRSLDLYYPGKYCL